MPTLLINSKELSAALPSIFDDILIDGKRIVILRERFHHGEQLLAGGRNERVFAFLSSGASSVLIFLPDGNNIVLFLEGHNVTTEVRSIQTGC